MLDFDSGDIDNMDDDAGDTDEPMPIRHWTATSSHDVYMVDTPKGSDNEEKGDGTGACFLRWVAFMGQESKLS